VTFFFQRIIHFVLCILQLRFVRDKLAADWTTRIVELRQAGIVGVTAMGYTATTSAISVQKSLPVTLAVLLTPAVF
jgi:hypothetical protein